MQRNMLAPLGFHSEGGCKRIGVSDAAARDAHIRSAQLCPCLDQCIEDLLQIERRAVDDLQHLRSARWNEEMDERSARRNQETGCQHGLRRSWNSVLQRTAGPYILHDCDIALK